MYFKIYVVEHYNKKHHQEINLTIIVVQEKKSLLCTLIWFSAHWPIPCLLPLQIAFQEKSTQHLF